MEVANTQAYYETATITAVKSFIVQDPGVHFGPKFVLVWEQKVDVTLLSVIWRNVVLLCVVIMASTILHNVILPNLILVSVVVPLQIYL